MNDGKLLAITFLILMGIAFGCGVLSGLSQNTGLYTPVNHILKCHNCNDTCRCHTCRDDIVCGICKEIIE